MFCELRLNGIICWGIGGVKDIKCAFVTGGTGLLGVNIVKELIQNTAAKIVLLVRNFT